MIESKHSDESPLGASAKTELGLIRSVSGDDLAEIAMILHTHSKANLECKLPSTPTSAVKRVNNGKVYGAYSRDGDLMGFIGGTKWGRLGVLGEMVALSMDVHCCVYECCGA